LTPETRYARSRNVNIAFQVFGKNISLNNNASSFPLPLAFQGIILAPNDALSTTNANLVGRLWGGDSSDLQFVSGSTLISSGVPEPSTWAMMLIGSAAWASRSVTHDARCRSPNFLIATARR
jgi:PEP-CTERM motif